MGKVENDWIHKWLDRLEAAGNRLPTPTLLFIWLCIGVILLSSLGAWLDWQVVHPVTQAPVTVVNLLSAEGLRRILTQTVSNYIEFAPLGPVLVAMLGLGISERSGLLQQLLTRLLLLVRGSGISFVVVLAGVLSSLAADAGYVVLIPLAALLFQASGRPPLAGIAAAFMGVSGGYSANIFIGPIDVILAGISSEAAALATPDYEVAVTANYYFMLASTLLITLLGGWLTERIIIPRLRRQQHLEEENVTAVHIPTSDSTVSSELTQRERHALRMTGLVFGCFVMILLWLTVPENGILRHPETGSLVKSPFTEGIVVVIAGLFAVCGWIYGVMSGGFTSTRTAISAMDDTFATLAGYMVLMFFAAQFVNYFAWSQLGLLFAVKGATLLAELDISRPVLLVLLLLLVASINLLIGSASAKWALLAPIFVPMLLMVGIKPEWTQVTYRIADSSTNIVTPLMPYFALVVAYIQRYQPQAGVGTLVALMLPYSASLLATWSLCLVIWFALGLPLGPPVN